MDIYFTYESGVCDQHQKEDDGELFTITKVIAPLRVQGNDQDGLKLISGCNFYKGCRNSGCEYSQAARELSKRTNPKKIAKHPQRV